MIDQSVLNTSWHSYPSLQAIGHRYLSSLFVGPVTVEEKVDGSQFSFGVIKGELKFKTKNAELFVTPDGHSSEKMFEKAVQSVLKRRYLLREDWTYRVEYLPKPKAITLVYDRVPNDFLIGFDVALGEEYYMTYADKKIEFDRLGLETVPLLHQGQIEDITVLKTMLERTSVLGGQLIEGVVVKNYNQFGPDKKILIGKYVSKDFKEIHGESWKAENPKQGDIVQEIIGKVKTTARWRKAVQHLTEVGKLTQSPPDIALLFDEVPEDIKRECEADIKDMLFEWAWDKISRGCTAGMAEWYKTELAKGQEFGKPEAHEPKTYAGHTDYNEYLRDAVR